MRFRWALPAEGTPHPAPGSALCDTGDSPGLSTPDTTAHGDTVTTIPIPATQAETVAATGCDGWADYTEYGAPRAGSDTTRVGGTVGYGWLGGKQRSTTTESAGLTLMGDRFYNPTRGAFTSLDPEPGGNDTAYSYPNDPINKYDLNGHWGQWKKWAKAAGRFAWKYKYDIALTAASFVPGVNAVAWGVRGAVWAARGARAYNSAKKVEYGLRLAQRYNAGRARVTMSGRLGKTHYDLYGRSHGGIPTPHKYTHYYGRGGFMGKKGPVTRMGWRDLWRVRNYLR